LEEGEDAMVLFDLLLYSRAFKRRKEYLNLIIIKVINQEKREVTFFIEINFSFSSITTRCCGE
jgi:hypothetical protein